MPQGILAKWKAKKHSTRHQPRLFTGQEPARGLVQARRLSNARGSRRVGPEIIEISWVGSGDEVVKNLTGRVSSRETISWVGSGRGWATRLQKFHGSGQITLFCSFTREEK